VTEIAMFDVDQFVHDCRAARTESQPAVAVKEVLQRVVQEPSSVATALPAERAAIAPLHVSPELTVPEVVWAPRMSFRPHNRLMWAAIGLYGGQEDNEWDAETFEEIPYDFARTVRQFDDANRPPASDPEEER
jgi:predicted metal-dependent enzyme (double-stranded beta helix superfamily)